MTGRIFNIKKLIPGYPVPIALLITFRIFFGSLMFLSILRFWWRGWVTSLYIEPKFHFTYTGFEWVHPPGYWGVHLLFLLVALAAFFITVGFLYRIASIVFFAGFTYIELIDVTTYLNHYYFVSLIAFILIWLPANRNYSLDVLLWPDKTKHFVPASSVGIIRFQLALVYIFAGLAKLNADWLLHAQPMRIWLPAKTHLPIIGIYMYETWVAYLFSWFGAAYDLLIVFFLLNKKTRPWAYCLVVIFHVATAIFFPAIGMFPYVMIICSLIFFSARFHEKLLSFFPFYRSRKEILQTTGYTYRFRYGKVLLVGMGIYIFLQVLIPLRFLLYPGNLFWNEEGYRFSWRVMLMEKSGSTYFTVKDKIHQQSFEVNNAEFLTPLQEKMMSTQPDMILKYAHFLAREYKNRGVQNPEVYGEIYVALNGGRSQLFVDSSINLAAEPLTWKHYEWILPYKK